MQENGEVQFTLTSVATLFIVEADCWDEFEYSDHTAPPYIENDLLSKKLSQSIPTLAELGSEEAARRVAMGWEVLGYNLHLDQRPAPLQAEVWHPLNRRLRGGY